MIPLKSGMRKHPAFFFTQKEKPVGNYGKKSGNRIGEKLKHLTYLLFVRAEVLTVFSLCGLIKIPQTWHYSL